VIGAAVGAAAIGGGGYRGMAVAALAQGVLAAALVLPLLPQGMEPPESRRTRAPK
jgi:hypothetical protein